VGDKVQRASEVRAIAREAFGYDRLRPGQPEAVQSVLAGRDTLAVMPTGSGKSAIYQIAGLLMPGGTVVVSPLIALQQDQLAALDVQEAATAAVVNSTLSENEREAALHNLEGEHLEFVFLAPEQFTNPETVARLQEARLSLFVVDEAHCISEWGHDFRPDYLRLGSIIEALGHPTVLALTATAAPPVRQEIVERLGLRDARVIVRGFDRPNIWLGVETFQDDIAKERSFVNRVVAADRPGIAYVATRRHAEDVARLLAEQGLRVAAYHAGLSAKERQRVQQAFMADEFDVIVATIAFGMGIDKPNVRFVYHYDIPDSVDAYYQEIGRGGRDGEPAQAILFYAPSDLGLQKFLASSGKLDPEAVQQLVEVVQGQDEPMTTAELSDATELSKGKLANALQHLEESGAVERLTTGEVMASSEDVDPAAAAAAAAQAQERRRQLERSRVEMIRGYAEARDCRRRYLLSYFGEDYPEPCGYCDNCAAGLLPAQGSQPFAVNSRVQHRQWGAGQILRYEGDTMVVLFDDVGYKTLAVDVVTSSGLLAAA
jgi:ATP-dependent DNA helicase RecQ